MNSIYQDIDSALAGLLEGESDWICNLSNTAAVLWMYLPEINWAGFYLRQGDELVLGPFQGKPACTRIPIGRGVCGTAAAELEPQLVADVHAFEGHIACDAASESEVVIPMIKDGELIGVLDVDAPVKSRFSQEDVVGLQAVVERLLANA
ncbi:GAF domain-containing protein [uncultured Pseudoteredinibacter sp.]|uniref:GAF domain-containing protein n=1 Tax=uncultured Pseudoteredinibacter sp. TaxID=1641701 RepID=UPI002618CD69|nr:GAF domain-containing protein [uncultured Pseudoteredinibacter sp.]